jgi:hypothetical protein
MPDAPPPRDYLTEITDALAGNDAKALAKIAIELYGKAARDEARRASEADRKRRSRHGTSRDVTGRHGTGVTAYTSSTPLDTRTESRDYADVTSRDVTGHIGGEVDEVIQQRLDLLRGAMGDERFPAADGFIRRRPYRTWKGWLDGMLTLIGPVSQFTAADLERVCADDAALDRPIGSPHGMRVFLHKAKTERLAGQKAEAPAGKPTVQLQPEAAAEFEKVRDIVNVGDLRNLDASKITGLSPRTRTALKAIGGHMAVKQCKPDQLTWMKKDFIAAYVAAGASAA